MKHFLLVLIIASFSTTAFAAGSKSRLGIEGTDEVFQLCEQLGATDGTTILVEQCTNEDNCIVIKVDCALTDDPPK